MLRLADLDLVDSDFDVDDMDRLMDEKVWGTIRQKARGHTGGVSSAKRAAGVSSGEKQKGGGAKVRTGGAPVHTEQAEDDVGSKPRRKRGPFGKKSRRPLQEGQSGVLGPLWTCCHAESPGPAEDRIDVGARSGLDPFPDDIDLESGSENFSDHDADDLREDYYEKPPAPPRAVLVETPPHLEEDPHPHPELEDQQAGPGARTDVAFDEEEEEDSRAAKPPPRTRRTPAQLVKTFCRNPVKGTFQIAGSIVAEGMELTAGVLEASVNVATAGAAFAMDAVVPENLALSGGVVKEAVFPDVKRLRNASLKSIGMDLEGNLR